MSRTSAEPSRTTAYSPDIGWRIVWQKLGMDLTFRQIAERLQIAVGTAHRIFKRFLDTGDVSPIMCKGKARPNLRKLDQYHELYILCMISDNPGLYLSEIRGKIYDSTNTRLWFHNMSYIASKWLYKEENCSSCQTEVFGIQRCIHG